MIRFELKKIWKNHIFLLLLGILAILNVIKIVSSDTRYNNGDSFEKARSTLYEQAEGNWDKKKINYVIENYKALASAVEKGGYSTEENQAGTFTGYVYGDYNLFREIYDKMNYMYNYPSANKETLKKAQENVDFYKEKNNEYKLKESQLILKLYSDRNISGFYDTDGVYSLICYDFSSVIVLLGMILGISSLFTCEKETEMNLLLKTAKNGGKRLITSKIIAGMITASALTLLFTVIDITAFTTLYGIECFSNPLYSISAFQNTPLSCSVGTYLMINFIYRLCGMLVMSLIFMLISALSADDIMSFCGCFAVTLLMIFIDVEWDPIILLTSRKLFIDFSAVNIFAYPVMKYIIILPIMVLTDAVLVLLIHRFGGKINSHRFTIKNLLRKGKELIV